MDLGRTRAGAQITVFTNGRIYTMDKPWPVEAMAVQQGRPVGLRASRECRRTAGGTPVDLTSRVIRPGMINSQCHSIRQSRRLTQAILESIRTKQEVLRMVAQQARELSP